MRSFEIKQRIPIEILPPMQREGPVRSSDMRLYRYPFLNVPLDVKDLTVCYDGSTRIRDARYAPPTIELYCKTEGRTTTTYHVADAAYTPPTVCTLLLTSPEGTQMAAPTLIRSTAAPKQTETDTDIFNIPKVVAERVAVRYMFCQGLTPPPKEDEPEEGEGAAATADAKPKKPLRTSLPKRRPPTRRYKDGGELGEFEEVDSEMASEGSVGMDEQMDAGASDDDDDIENHVTIDVDDQQWDKVRELDNSDDEAHGPPVDGDDAMRARQNLMIAADIVSAEVGDKIFKRKKKRGRAEDGEDGDASDFDGSIDGRSDDEDIIEDDDLEDDSENDGAIPDDVAEAVEKVQTELKKEKKKRKKAEVKEGDVPATEGPVAGPIDDATALVQRREAGPTTTRKRRRGGGGDDD